MLIKKKLKIDKTKRYSKWVISHGDMIELLKSLDNSKPSKIGK